VITDIHETHQAGEAAQVRGCPADPRVPLPPDRSAKGGGGDRARVNVKKGRSSRRSTSATSSRSSSRRQSPDHDTERGTSFGYNNLVVDMRAFR